MAAHPRWNLFSHLLESQSASQSFPTVVRRLCINPIRLLSSALSDIEVTI